MLLPLIAFTPVSLPAQALSNIWTSSQFPWELMAVIAVLVSFALSAISFMFSRLFSSKDLEKFAKSEFMFALSSAVLIAFLIFFIDVIAVKSTAFVVSLSSDRPILMPIVQANPSPFTVAEFYLNHTSVCAQTKYIEAIGLAIPVSALASVQWSGGGNTSQGLPSSAQSTLRVLANNTLTRNIVTTANGYLTGIVYDLVYINYLIYVQKNLLIFAEQTMLLIFLPIGVVLRAFPMVRGTGNLMIALAIGMYFVYPMTYGILMVLGRPIDNFDTICGTAGISDVAASTNWIPFGSVISDMTRVGQSILDRYSAQVSEQTSIIDAFLTTAQTLISEMVIYTVVFPFVVAVVTYTFIKSFASFLNVEAQEFAQGLIRLV